jgi:hypothetical protein
LLVPTPHLLCSTPQMNIKQCRHLRGHSSISKTTQQKKKKKKKKRKTLATYTDCHSVSPRDTLQLWYVPNWSKERRMPTSFLPSRKTTSSFSAKNPIQKAHWASNPTQV